jgi:hypothetical protein
MVYLIQFDLIEDNKDNKNKSSQLIDKICELGSFCIDKNQYYLHTQLNKKQITNKLKKIIFNDEQIFIKEISENNFKNFDNLPFIIKDWFKKDLLCSELNELNNENQIKSKSNNFIKESYEDIKQEALNRLNTILDSVKAELNKNN